jgi:[NiFe] hydrogenase diaphorase moiety small subunit
MSASITFTIDAQPVTGEPGQTILEVAQAAGIYIPRLCHRDGLEPYGSCRVCMVLVNGRPQSACTLPIANGMLVENDSERMQAYRRQIVEMLFVEGNHYCMFCEKSGNCELQALAYRLGITAPRYPYQFPQRCVDASHPDILVDHNRCILCARCIRASRDLDGKNVFQFVGRGIHKRVGVNADARLAAPIWRPRTRPPTCARWAPSSRNAPPTPYPLACVCTIGSRSARKSKPPPRT